MLGVRQSAQSPTRRVRSSSVRTGAPPLADDDRHAGPPRRFEPIPDVDALVSKRLPQAAEAVRPIPALQEEEELVGPLTATI